MSHPRATLVSANKRRMATHVLVRRDSPETAARLIRIIVRPSLAKMEDSARIYSMTLNACASPTSTGTDAKTRDKSVRKKDVLTELRVCQSTRPDASVSVNLASPAERVKPTLMSVSLIPVYTEESARTVTIGTHVNAPRDTRESTVNRDHLSAPTH